MEHPKHIEVDGQTFRLSGGYYKRHITVFLHRYIWEKYNGPIPDGYHIHHKDGNKLNNDIANLECISQSDHHRKHWKEDYGKMYKFTSENIRKAIAWRSTEEAKPILSQKSKKAWNNRAAKKCICKRCGSEFESRMDKLAFWCSNKCKKDQHYEDNQIIRKCKMCDKEFRVYRYSETFTCSRTCAGMHSHLRRKKNVADKQSNITGN